MIKDRNCRTMSQRGHVNLPDQLKLLGGAPDVYDIGLRVLGLL